jgi:hypothetical protein
MSKKLSWLDQFAQEQAKKEAMKRTASTKKVASEIIVNPEDVPGAEEGKTVEFNGETFTVKNANYSDEMGPGVVLEKSAAYEGLEQDPMGMAMGQSANGIDTPSNQGQQYSRTNPGDIYQTYTNDEDAEYGQSSAAATEQEIAGEDSVDRTTVPGKFTKSPGLGGGAVAPTPAVDAAPVGGEVAPTPEATEAPVEEDQDLVEVGVDVDENGEDLTEEPAAEETTEDAPAEDTEVPAEGEDKEENRVLARVKAKKAEKTAKTTKVSALNSRIITIASNVTDAITAETEEVLEDAEEAIKKSVPARFAKKALAMLETKLEKEGIEALFDKKVKREALKRTAGEEMKEDELEEVVASVVDAVVAEMEEVLKDADEEMDTEKGNVVAEGEDGVEVEAKIKSIVERKLHAKGIYARFARTAKKTASKKAPAKTVAQKIRDARRKK